MTLQFDGMFFDASFNIHNLHENSVKSWMASQDNAMNLYLVDLDSYRLMAIRTIGAHHDFLLELKEILSAQQKTMKTDSRSLTRSAILCAVIAFWK